MARENRVLGFLNFFIQSELVFTSDKPNIYAKKEFRVIGTLSCENELSRFIRV